MHARAKKSFKCYVVDSLRTRALNPYSIHTIIPVVANQAAIASWVQPSA